MSDNRSMSGSNFGYNATEEDVDKYLRAHGCDPEEVAAHGAEIAANTFAWVRERRIQRLLGLLLDTPDD